MAAPNTRYQTNSSSAQPAYTAFSVEQAIGAQWENIWLRTHPLLAMIREGKTNWNKGYEVAGNLILVPVVAADMTTAADGVADASELTPLTPEQTNDNAFSHAQFIIAHYRGAFWNRASETELINNKRGGGFLQGKVQQLMDSFSNATADDLASGNADSRSAVIGIRHVIATSNTVGNIAQGSIADWASNVTTGVGTFSLDVIDNPMDAVSPRRGKIDLMLFAWASGLNLFGKLRMAIAPSQMLVNTEFRAKYGFENIMYRDATCTLDNRGTSGEIIGLTTKAWGWAGDTKPKRKHVMDLPGTDAEEFVYNMFCSAWCKNPAQQFRLTGVT